MITAPRFGLSCFDPLQLMIVNAIGQASASFPETLS